MKANVPEKIYIQPNAHDGWFETNNLTESLTEYTQTNAFIEKAEKYLTEKFINDVSVLAGGVVSINFSTAIKNFVKYMKGEEV